MATSLFESVINSLEEILIATDLKKRILFINRAGEELLGVHAETVKHGKLSSVIHNASLIALVGKAIRETRPISGREITLATAGGEQFDFTVTPLIDRGSSAGAVLLLRKPSGFFKKDTDQFDSIMYLLATVAHEIKNPLAGIKGAAQLMRRTAAGGRADCLDVVVRETDRLDDIVKTYLFVGRKPMFNRINVHEVIEEALNVLAEAMKSRTIALKRSYDPSLPLIRGDEGKLLQVFLNIIKNAQEAMAAGGTLEIKTKPAFEYVIEKKKKIKMKFAVISFTDTGAGIAFQDQEKIFMPFFTSKKEGTGLGLAISKKIVLDHRGLIKIRAAPGGGTTAEVYLPFAE